MWFYYSVVECWVDILFYFTLYALGITMGSKIKTVLECGFIIPLWNVRFARLTVSVALQWALPSVNFYGVNWLKILVFVSSLCVGLCRTPSHR